MAMRLGAWLTAGLAGGIAALFAAALTERLTGRGGEAVIPWGLNYGFSAFSGSGWLAIAGMFVLFASWEGLGRAPGAIAYAIAAPLLSAAGLAAFTLAAYDYRPVLEIRLEELHLASALAAFGCFFALARKRSRRIA